MKKLLALVVAVLLASLVLTSCGGNVKTTVDSKYDDGFAKKYASSVTQDSNGNNVYAFSDDEQYKSFLSDYNVELSDGTHKELGYTNAQYVFISKDGTEMEVGVEPGHVEELGLDGAKKEAEKIGKENLKYNMNTQNPTGKISVKYKDAYSGEDYFTIEVTAD